MPGRIYLVTSTGDNIVTSGGDRIYYRDLLARYLDLAHTLSARAKRYVDFYADLFTRISRYVDLAHDVEAYAAHGYTLYAKNLATGVITNLGFIDVAAPTLELTDVALDDGTYEIEVRVQGYYWQDMRCATRFAVQVAGGELVVPLPIVAALNYSYNLTDTRVKWNWTAQAGTVQPDDFAIWTGAAEPVDTSGAPGYTVPAVSPGDYATNIAQGGAAIYVAVAARQGATKGPISTLTIPAPPAAVDSPENQRVLRKT